MLVAASFFILASVAAFMEFPFNIAALGLSTVIVIILLIQNIPKLVKWCSIPKLSAHMITYPHSTIKQDGVSQSDTEVWYDSELQVQAGTRPVITFAIKPKWTYEIKVIEILGHSKSKITSERLFSNQLRYWQEKEYVDVHGDYKVPANIVMRKGDITEPLILDVRIEPPLQKGERRKLTMRVSTKESEKLFVKEFFIEAQ